MTAFLNSNTGLMLFALLDAALAMAIFALWRRHRTRQAGFDQMPGRLQPAPQQMIDDLVLRAETSGKKDLVLRELAAMRRDYGDEALCVGHVLRVRAKLNEALATERAMRQRAPN